MARPLKTGIDYFSFSVDFFEDDKLQLISSEFGLKGEIIAIRLLCKIYKNGYFYKWGTDESFLLAKRVGHGLTGSLVSEIVMRLVKRSFFDERVFNSFQILTSKGIQKRYLEATFRYKRLELIKEYLLIQVPKNENICLILINDNTNRINVNTNRINDNISTQMKLNEIKLNEKKEKEIVVNSNVSDVVLSLEERECEREKNFNEGEYNDIINDNFNEGEFEEEQKQDSPKLYNVDNFQEKQNSVMENKILNSEITDILDKIIKATKDIKSTNFWLKSIRTLGRDRMYAVLKDFNEYASKNKIKKKGAYLTKMINEAGTQNAGVR
jgi:hypothetical protein